MRSVSRSTLAAAAGLALLAAWIAGSLLISLHAVSAQADAASYPNRLIRIAHLYTAGGGNDIVARLLGNELAARWKVNVIVEPRPGGAGIIGSDYVAKSAPDGYTLLLASDALTIMPALGNLPFEIPDSFSPIMLVGTVPFVLVASNSAPFRTIDELLAYARAHPGEVPYASVGVGTPHHLTMELLKAKTGINLVHVPYRGAAAQMQDILAGQVPVGFSSISAGIGPVRAGSVRALAVTAPERLPMLPDVPTLREKGLGDVEVQGWYGLLAPAGTPAPVVERIRAEVAAILSNDDMAAKLAAQGVSRTGDSDPSSFTVLIKHEVAQWTGLIASQKLSIK